MIVFFLAQNPGLGLYDNREQQETEYLRKKSGILQKDNGFFRVVQKKEKNKEKMK